MYDVNEIFCSFDGEVNFFGQGKRSVFIRLQGCNLYCDFCDSPATIDSQGTKINTEDLISKVIDYNCNKVTITGGEPLLQDITDLVCELKKKGIKISVETNGTIMPSILLLNLVDCWIVDCKIGSKEWKEKSDFVFSALRSTDWIKFIIKTEEDFIKSIETQHILNTKANFAWSPILPDVDYRQMWNWMDINKVNGVLNIQLHKLIGVR